MADLSKTRLTTTETSSMSSDDSQSLRHRLTPWLFDLVSLLISLICMLAIVALLLRYDDKSVPDWHGVTLNTVIGYLAQAAQIGLAAALGNAISQLKWLWYWQRSRPRQVNDFQAYDAASRGFFGSLSAIIRPWKWPIFSFGAALTLANLLIHPFLQTIPITRVRLVPSAGLAAVSRATNFSSLIPDTQGSESEAFEYVVLDSATKGAIYAGLFNYTSYAAVAANCPSGNCTWSPYTSLGICSACNTVTPTASYDSAGLDGPGYTYAIGNSLSIESSEESMVVSSDAALSTMNQLAEYTVAGMLSMYYPQPVESMNMAAPKAFECALYFCVRKYSAEVSNGQLVETILSTFPTGSTPSDLAQASIEWPGGFRGLKEGSVSYLPDVGNETRFVHITPPDDDTIYDVNGDTFALMMNWFQEQLQGSIDAGAILPNSLTDIAQVLYSSQVIEDGPGALMDRIASSLTAQLRNSTGEMALGTTQTVEQYLFVRWRWAIVPLAVLVLTLVFLIITITLSARKRVPTWRSSALPPLIYSLDADTSRQIARNGPRLNSLEREAGKYAMAMLRDGIWALEGTGVATPHQRHK